jgi:SAM-dependent methyltransferase
VNLYDLVKRRDRWIDGPNGLAAIEAKLPAGTQRGARFPAGGALRVREAHAARCLADFPTDVGWQAQGQGEWRLAVNLCAEGRRWPLAAVAGDRAPVAVPLRWPAPTPRAFDLEIEVVSARPVDVLCGPLWTPRTDLVPLLRGDGVELGPGLNPVVLPGPDVRVRYVEKKHPSQWAATYAKRELTAAEQALWDRYLVDSARFPTAIPPGSLDFVFSHHVLEHLVDPIGVLVRWWERLAPGGLLAGVVPDARFTFDWRQPAWSIADVRAQAGVVDDAPTDAMFERWCRHTAPDTTPASLRGRDYSIHVNYFTPDLLRLVLDDVVARVDAAGGATPDGVFLNAVRNGKDFGFLLRKPTAGR